MPVRVRFIVGKPVPITVLRLSQKLDVAVTPRESPPRLLEPTLPQYWLFNPGYAQVQTEHVWSQGWMDIIQNGITPEAAAEKAFKRIEEIFTKYPIEQA